MKKAFAIVLTKTVILTLTFTMAIATWVGFSGAGWFMHNEHLETKSSPIYSINQGQSGDLIIDNEEFKRIYQSDEQETQVTMTPGDLVYYTFIFQVPLDDLTAAIENGKIDYSVSLNLDPKTYGAVTAGKNGNVDAFLGNLTVEENACSVSVMERGTVKKSEATGDAGDADIPIFYYDFISYVKSGDSYVKAASDTEGATAIFTHESEGAVVSNNEVGSFLEGSVAKADFDISIPLFSDVEQYPVWIAPKIAEEGGEGGEEEDGGKFVFFMLYVPIWYRDTGVNQNDEMYSQLDVNGCTLIPAEITEPEPEPTPAG